MSVTLQRLRALQAQRGTPALHPTAALSPTLRPVAAEPASTPALARLATGPHAPTPGAPPLAGARRAPVVPPVVRPAAQSIESLRRLLGVRHRVVVRPRPALDRAIPGEQVAPGLFLTTAHLPLPVPVQALPLAFARRDDAVDPRALLFFDTETTGLAGGTGTRAFMVGAADWYLDPVLGDGLRIRQLLTTTMAAEESMLAMFASWLSPGTVLSSYNGRCYDAPLLKTRYRLARMACPLTALDHVDLLFPTRRRYRGVWENCRLATVERELLRVVREDDLPGSEAPAAWLTYLRGGAATLLRRVAAHNHQDVVTLSLLLRRLVDEHAGDAMRGDAAASPHGAS